MARRVWNTLWIGLLATAVFGSAWGQSLPPQRLSADLAAQPVVHVSGPSSSASASLVPPIPAGSVGAAASQSYQPTEAESPAAAAEVFTPTPAAPPPVSIEKTWPLPDLVAAPGNPLWAVDYERTTVPFADAIRAAATDLATRVAPAADLPLFVPTPTVRAGSQGSNVEALVARLRAEGYLPDADIAPPNAPELPAPSSSTLDPVSGASVAAQTSIAKGALAGVPPAAEATPEVIAAIRAFQKDNHLTVDGVAGSAVAQVINSDPTREAAALQVWATAVEQQVAGARAAGARYLALVNIPSFTLHLLDTSTGAQVLESAVVVGSPSRRTPRFWTAIVNLKVSPDWTLPASIGHGRVPPGPSNPLGLVRFSTNNAQDIFLHDTNAHGLFARSNRAASHGCVRVQNWPGLAQVLGGLTVEQLSDYLSHRRTEYHKVPAKVLVRTILSRVDLVKGRPMSAADPYAQGDLAIGAPSLDGRPEGDPALRFAPSPSDAPGPADWGYKPTASAPPIPADPHQDATDTVGP